MDTDQDGKLSLEASCCNPGFGFALSQQYFRLEQEVRASAEACGLPGSVEEITNLFKAADMDHNCFLDFKEFVVVLATLFVLKGKEGLNSDAVEAFSLVGTSFALAPSSRGATTSDKTLCCRLWRHSCILTPPLTGTCTRSVN